MKSEPVRQQLKNLIIAIGGSESLKKILLQFYQNLSQDILVGFFFTGRDLIQISNKQAEFMLNAAGLLTAYSGKGPSTAHVALPPILSGHFDRRLVILRETLVAHHVPEPLVDQWIQFEESFRKIVVA